MDLANRLLSAGVDRNLKNILKWLCKTCTSDESKRAVDKKTQKKELFQNYYNIVEI